MITSDDEAVYLKAARDLARMTPPDLSGFSAREIEIAMLRVFERNGPQEGWLNEFRGRIKQASENAVRMEPAERADFPHPHEKSPAASHQRLVDSVAPATQLLVMGPFDPPFRFVPDSGPEENQENPENPENQ
ncbi:hypothetical protein [Streptomyces sp. NBC_00878]|uniref:hypothetical protein n=1 Tax=Streptomyces sp. NBC_00878 TaxID=2975854 RepID=UPI00225BA87C|nr:hypothetical protein [Streptomyces sp. NBC_00878]MCX4907298.1 hypothetical protein [Streptomyces sp. NBC_00878]